MTQPKISNNNTNTQNKSLSVQVSLTGHSFLMTSLNAEEATLFSEKKYPRAKNPEDILEDLKEAFNQDQAFQNEFTSVKLLFQSDIYTVVPLPLFDENKASDYLKFNTKILANDYIAFDVVEEHNFVVVYVPFVNVNNYFFDRFGEFSFYHSATILLQSLLNENKFNSKKKVFINIGHSNFDCIALDGQKLLLCNSYTFTTPEDLIYYVLFIMEQLKLNPDSVETNVFGEILEDDANFEILYRYVRNVSIYKDFDAITLQGVASHQQVPLKLLSTCE